MTAVPAGIDVQPCDGGPLLVRGASVWTDDTGTAHPIGRPVVAVCRCTKSSLRPWCDGTHKLLREAPELDPRGSAS
jgi:CDGSH-type Zn-finger protein